MKKKIIKNLFKIIFICYFITINKLNAQEWVKVNPIFDPPGNYNTYTGCFVNERIGWWITGPHGKLWFTTNGGYLWTKSLDSIWVDSGIEFVDSLHGWVVGLGLPNQYLCITKDGGKNWSKSLTPINIFCWTFFDSLNGFAGGEDTIYATIDGGVTWQAQTIEPGVRFGIMDIYFVDKKNGWAVGGSSTIWDAGIILNTTDGGKYWKINEHPSGVTGYAVYFTDSLHGYVVGSNPPFFEGVIYVTSNGGVSWIIHYLPCTWLNDVVFTDDSTGWVIGYDGFIWNTTDRGLNWKRIESGTTSHLYRIFFFDSGRIGYILGADSTILKYDKTVGIKEEQSLNELSFKLHQKFPNPFNPLTTIKYDLSEDVHVTIRIYDVLGREVVTLVDDFQDAGYKSVNFDASNLPSGVYFYRMTAGHYADIKKMILLR
ncbi:MAG: YCF48-related protein [Bacteroidota bacterium]|nr:YCF48-related protein [Bacteroidota bacterium]